MKTNASRHGHWGSIGAVLEPRRQRQSETTKKNGQENTGAKLNQQRETEWRRPLAQTQRFDDACAPASTQRPQAAARPSAKPARTGKTSGTATHQKKKKKRERPARFDRIGRCQPGRVPSAQPAADRAACPVRAPRRRNLNGAQNTFAPMTRILGLFCFDPAQAPTLAFSAKRRSRPASPKPSAQQGPACLPALRCPRFSGRRISPKAAQRTTVWSRWRRSPRDRPKRGDEQNTLPISPPLTDERDATAERRGGGARGAEKDSNGFGGEPTPARQADPGSDPARLGDEINGAGRLSNCCFRASSDNRGEKGRPRRRAPSIARCATDKRRGSATNRRGQSPGKPADPPQRRWDGLRRR